MNQGIFCFHIQTHVTNQILLFLLKFPKWVAKQKTKTEVSVKEVRKTVRCD